MRIIVVSPFLWLGPAIEAVSMEKAAGLWGSSFTLPDVLFQYVNLEKAARV
jgi:hypothetical protein